MSWRSCGSGHSVAPSSGGKLILGRAERYTIEQRHDGVVVTMRQGRHVLLVGLFCAGVLLLTWWFGPYGPQTAPAFRSGSDAFYWVWSGFFACAFLVSLFVAPFYSWNVIITGTEIIAQTSQYWWRRNRRMPRGQALGIWTEIIDDVDEGAMFPYRVHLLDAEGRVSGIYVELQRRRGAEQLVEALRMALTLDVKDGRPR